LRCVRAAGKAHAHTILNVGCRRGPFTPEIKEEDKIPSRKSFHSSGSAMSVFDKKKQKLKRN